MVVHEHDVLLATLAVMSPQWLLRFVDTFVANISCIHFGVYLVAVTQNFLQVSALISWRWTTSLFLCHYLSRFRIPRVTLDTFDVKVDERCNRYSNASSQSLNRDY